MKNTLTIIIAMCIWGNLILAQSDLTKPYDMNNGSSIISEKESNDSFLGIDISERIITTTIILGELILLLVLIFYWKKNRNNNPTKSKNVYKNNIRAIRDERVKPIVNLKVTAKRRGLKNKLSTNKLDGKIITLTAKKLAISKGELFLAAKIQQLQSQVK